MLGNWFKTTLLMAAVIALFGVVGATLGGAEGMLIALLLGGGMNFFAYGFPTKWSCGCMARAKSMPRARLKYYATVRELAGRAGIPMPKSLCDRRSAAQCIRDGPQSSARGGRGNHGYTAAADRARTARRDGARARARQAPRHPDVDDRRHHGGRHLGDRAFRLSVRRPRATTARIRSLRSWS